MRKIALLGLISIVFLQIGVSQQEITVTLNHDDIDRTYILYIPAGYDASGDKFSLVFNFHGFTSNANQQKNYSAMNDVAEANDFIVCYPNGIGNAWNVGLGIGNVDDIGFTQAMIDEISSEYTIDHQRIYACGMSNGGFFSYRLACELSDTFAAVASVTGSFTDDMLANCSPSRKVPVMEVHGTDDFIVPYDGMEGTAVPIEDVVDFWVDHNICNTTADTTAIENTNTTDGCTSEMIEYLDCEEDGEVVFVKITGGGHSWPGGTIPLPGTSQDYNGSQLVWDFFTRHELPAVLSNKEINYATLSVFPNPAFDLLQIELDGIEQFQSFIVYNLSGKVVELGKHKIIDTSSLKSGLYILEVISTKGNRYIEKIILE